MNKLMLSVTLVALLALSACEKKADEVVPADPAVVPAPEASGSEMAPETPAAETEMAPETPAN